jgi:hypothetical protein
MASPIHERIEECVPKGKWFTLKEICSMVDSSSSSYVKMTLFALPHISFRKVLTSSGSEFFSRFPTSSKWCWEFKVGKRDAL